jgi:hypothetical protein
MIFKTSPLIVVLAYRSYSKLYQKYYKYSIKIKKGLQILLTYLYGYGEPLLKAKMFSSFLEKTNAKEWMDSWLLYGNG